MANVTINYKPTAKQKIFHASHANEILYGGAAGGGKELWVDTPIMTPDGFVPIGDIQSDAGDAEHHGQAT